jgi:hypothetical protein
VRRSGIRRELHGFLQMAERLGDPAFGKVGVPEVRDAHPRTGLQPERRLEVTDRLGPLALAQQQLAEFFVADGKIRLQLERLSVSSRSPPRAWPACSCAPASMKCASDSSALWRSYRARARARWRNRGCG